jgi:hypothetical protein
MTFKIIYVMSKISNFNISVTFDEVIVINGSLCNASCSLQQNHTSGRHVLHLVDEIVLHKKQGPSRSVNGDKESELQFV